MPNKLFGWQTPQEYADELALKKLMGVDVRPGTPLKYTNEDLVVPDSPTITPTQPTPDTASALGVVTQQKDAAPMAPIPTADMEPSARDQMLEDWAKAYDPERWEEAKAAADKMAINPLVLIGATLKGLGTGGQGADQIINMAQKYGQQKHLDPIREEREAISRKLDFGLKLDNSELSKLNLTKEQNEAIIRQKEDDPNSNISITAQSVLADIYPEEDWSNKSATELKTLSPWVKAKIEARLKQAAMDLKKGEKRDKKTDDDFKKSQDLSDDLQKAKKDYTAVNQAYSRIQAVDNSPAGNISLIFNYMKMLDPGSTVREGEFATAQNAAGIPERVVNMYNKALNGEFLSPAQIADFKKQANGLLKAAEGTFRQDEQRIKDKAQYWGLEWEGIAGKEPAPKTNTGYENMSDEDLLNSL